jgi:hypothetical protein
MSKKRHTVPRESYLFLKKYKGVGKPAIRPDELSAMNLRIKVMIDARTAKMPAGRGLGILNGQQSSQRQSCTTGDT